MSFKGDLSEFKEFIIEELFQDAVSYVESLGQEMAHVIYYRGTDTFSVNGHDLPAHYNDALYDWA